MEELLLKFLTVGKAMESIYTGFYCDEESAIIFCPSLKDANDIAKNINNEKCVVLDTPEYVCVTIIDEATGLPFKLTK